MSSPWLPVQPPPSRLQPLAELPALAVADARRDVRGWEIRSDDGEVLGLVSDLLADPDRLVAEYLVVSLVKDGGVKVFVPVANLAMRPEYLVLGSGVQPIKLRYVSTLRLTATTAAAAALVVIILWSLRIFAC